MTVEEVKERQFKGWIGVDFDGTLAEYHGWKGPSVLGKPIPKMLTRVRRWLEEGKEVRILTARVAHDSTQARMLEAAAAHYAIRDWCVQYLGREIPVTCVKDWGMHELWDDRAIQVRQNTGERADGEPEGMVTP